MQIMLASDAVRPFIRFETRAVQDRAASENEGRPVYKNVDFVVLMQKGSKDEYTKEADEWFTQKKREAANGAYSSDWLRSFREAYDAWKQGRDAPINGTPLQMWPGITPAEIEMCKGIGCYSVEDVANMTEEALSRFLGSRALRDKARAYMAAAKDAGKVSEENAALRVQVSDLTEQLQAMRSRLAALENSDEARRGPGRPRKEAA